MPQIIARFELTNICVNKEIFNQTQWFNIIIIYGYKACITLASIRRVKRAPDVLHLSCEYNVSAYKKYKLKTSVDGS